MLPATPTSSFPYRILAKVGEGAMGEVYRAEDVELGRPVAIKVVKPAFLDGLDDAEAQGALQHFVQEARAAAAISHPGITTVHRIGIEAGWPFIAMEWLEGRTLEALLSERGRLLPVHAVRLGLQILSALDTAHRAGIVHRDIKPANLMITAGGRIKVTDFGIARVLGAPLAQTQVGLVLGTPQYAAPEQLAGRAVDGRADLYAVGAVLYEVVAGKPPINAPNVFELMGRIQTEVPIPPSRLVPAVPAGLDEALGRALEKDPARRYTSAAEMARALQPLLTDTGGAGAGSPARAQPGPPVRPTVPTIRVEGASVGSLVVETVRRWPATPLGRQRLAGLLDRLVERPLHAPAFTGGVIVQQALILIFDGVVFTAVDPRAGATGDTVLESLPAEVDATLYACPQDLDPRVVTLLASIVVPGAPRLSGVDAGFVDVPQLTRKLGAEGFDGVVRFSKGPLLGVLLVSRGKRVLDVFGPGWPADPTAHAWEQWLAATGATASIEDRRTSFPTVTFRRMLRDLVLDVVRPGPRGDAGVVSDARADAEAIQLRPSPGARAATPGGVHVPGPGRGRPVARAGQVDARRSRPPVRAVHA